MRVTKVMQACEIACKNVGRVDLITLTLATTRWVGGANPAYGLAVLLLRTRKQRRLLGARCFLEWPIGFVRNTTVLILAPSGET